MPVSATKFDGRADRRQTPKLRAWRSPARPGGGRLPSGGRPRARRCRGRGSSSTRSPTANRQAAPSSWARSLADTEVAGGKAAAVGPPSIDIDERRDMRLLYDANGTPRVIEGTDRGPRRRRSRSGRRFAGDPNEAAVSVMNPEGGGVSAWPSADPHGRPAVAVREDFPDGAVQTALVSGGGGGDRRTVGRTLGPRRRARRLPRGPDRRRGDRGERGHRPARPVPDHRAERLGQARRGGRLLGARRERKRPAHLRRSCSTGTH